MNNHFCNCPVIDCPQHPINHGQGCDSCIKDNLKKGKIPSCFFIKVSEDVSNVSDFTIKGFVDFYNSVNKK